ncbi:MAG: PHP domain-containing protein [Ignavibacteria bacterium]|nr:MAG: PHP domain-containing protein [Ignavibacteria bacterium]
MLNRKVDLHSHTNHSDGYYSPEELVSKAKDVGIDILSITDHDSTNAIEKATKIGRELGVEIIPGVEISSDIRGIEVHILGYFIDITNKELEHYLKFFRDERIRRANNIVRKLNHLGLNISMTDVMRISKNSAIGRPHIAQAMLELELVKSFQDAFNKYIRNGGPAYEGKVHLSPQSAFKIISDAGGLSFVAHPRHMSENIIKELIDAGADGIEVIHPSHTKELTRFYRGIVNEYYLLESGGSDFHGGKRADDDRFGKFFTTPIVVDAMRTRIMRNTA